MQIIVLRTLMIKYVAAKQATLIIQTPTFITQLHLTINSFLILCLMAV